jgi:hypothetical protein
MLFTLSIIAVMLIILGFALREVALFARRRESYKLRRLTLRLSMASMLLFLLGSILVGVTYFGLANPVGFDRYWIAFWAFITMLTFAIFCLAMADLRSLGEETDSAATALWQEMAQILAEHDRAKSNREEPPRDA